MFSSFNVITSVQYTAPPNIWSFKLQLYKFNLSQSLVIRESSSDGTTVSNFITPQLKMTKGSVCTQKLTEYESIFFT